MNTAEFLCDIRMIKADYRLISHKDRVPNHCFRVSIIPRKRDIQFDISEENGKLFAAELETLVAIIKARNSGKVSC